MNESIKDRFLKEHELTDEDLKQVSGGAFKDKEAGQSCPSDCEGLYVLQCRNTFCCHGRK